MKVEEAIDTMRKDITQIKVDMSEIRTDINYHIHRTGLLEKQLEKAEKRLKPLEKHVIVEAAIGKTFILLLTIGGALAGIYKAFF